MSRTEVEIEADIERVNAEIIPLRDKLGRLQYELHAFRLANCGVKVGEIVLAKDPRFGNKESEAIVREIQYISHGTAWLKVSFRKKDGTWAKWVNTVYEHWKKRPVPVDKP